MLSYWLFSEFDLYFVILQYIDLKWEKFLALAHCRNADSESIDGLTRK